MKFKLNIMIAVFLVVMTSHVFAQSSDQAQVPASSKIQTETQNIDKITGTDVRPVPEINFAWEFLKMMFVLFLICLFAFVILKWFIPKLSQVPSPSGRLLNVVSRYPIEPRKSLYVIKVIDEYHLVGVSDQGMNYLTKLPSDKVEEGLKNQEEFLKKGGFLEVFLKKSKAS